MAGEILSCGIFLADPQIQNFHENSDFWGSQKS
jgi:hypothetical protein